jgi:glycosyltransferase involved in cell wall biosynthesis
MPHYDYLIHPSHGETFGYTVLESLLSNLPVVTTANQGILEIGEPWLILFEEQDVILKS